VCAFSWFGYLHGAPSTELPLGYMIDFRIGETCPDAKAIKHVVDRSLRRHRIHTAKSTVEASQVDVTVLGEAVTRFWR